MKQAFLGLILLFLILSSCTSQPDAAKLDAFSRNQLHAWNQKLTEVIVKDIFTPPVASRIYVYPNVAAYEAQLPDHPGYQSLTGQLNGLQALPVPPAAKEHYLPAASIIA